MQSDLGAEQLGFEDVGALHDDGFLFLDATEHLDLLAVGFPQLDVADFEDPRFTLDEDELAVAVALHGRFGN